jgi:ATP-binding cassette subfamily B protein
MSDHDVTADADSDYPLLGLVREYGAADAHYLVAAVALVAAKSFVGFADVFVIGLAIDALFNGQALALPLVPDAWIPADPMGMLLFVGALLFAINLSTIVGGSLGNVCFGIFSQRILHRIRVAAFDAAQHRDLDYFDEARTGDVMSALNDDVNQLETFFDTLVGALVWIVVTLLAAIVYMGVLNWQLAAFVLAAGPIVAGVNYWYSQRLEPRQDDVRAERGALNAHLETGLSGVDVVKAFTAEEYERDRVEQSSYDHFRAKFHAERLAVTQAPLNRLLAGCWLLATLAIGIYWVLEGAPLFFSGTLTAGQLVPFLIYMERVTLPLKNLSGVIDGYNAANAAARRVDGVASGESGDTDQTERVAPANAQDVEGQVRFRDVTFSYPGGNQPAVDDVSFDVEPGETVGFVGSTGAGKSTLVKLLLRLYDPDDGTITVDARDAADYDPRDLRDAIGYVEQDAFLFNGTVAYNIAYGARDVSEERIRAAARKAGIHEEIRDLPDGYDTEVGDRGVKLSGGQRQRIAIARAIVADPPMLVLDEATSHVDNETERIVQRQLDELTADRTTFVVAHRLSTVRDADRILVLDDGELVESGSHDELLAREGAYATLWTIQVGAVDARAA